jgi:hypothetical protein
VPGDDHPRGSVTLQLSHRSKAALRSVVGLERLFAWASVLWEQLIKEDEGRPGTGRW